MDNGKAGGNGASLGEGCAPCVPGFGTNIIQSGRLLLLAGQTLDMTIEIRNGTFNYRFATGWTEPLSDLIDILEITVRRPGDGSESRLMRGDPIRLQQFTSDPRFGQALQFLEALDSAENNSQIVFRLQNLEAIQGVTVTIGLVGYWAIKPVDIKDRRPIYEACVPARQDVEPHRGPIAGAGKYGQS